VFSVIASDRKPTLVFRVNKLVKENDLFCPGKSGKSQGKLESSRSLQVPPPMQSSSAGGITIFALPAVLLCPL